MTNEQKRMVSELMGKGYGYKKIASLMGLSDNTVKSFCHRKKQDTAVTGGKHYCPNCGVEVRQNSGRKEKRFCSDKCRSAWWNSHQSQLGRKKVREFICCTCGKFFTGYGKADRKYCSHKCYIKDRFGGTNA